MICLLAPTEKELELGKSLSGCGLLWFFTQACKPVKCSSASRTHSDVAPDSASEKVQSFILYFDCGGLSTTAEFSIHPLCVTAVTKWLMSAFDALMTAEKVTENLAGMTSQVAPCDVSSVYGIRRAMGIAVPLETESFIDLTTGEHLTLETFVSVLPRKHLILFLPVQEVAELMEAVPSSSNTLPVVTA